MKAEDRFDAVQHMNDDFLRRDWGDGFPLLPPTRGAVDELLDGVSLPADHVVCDMPPGFGIATVEKIAVNAAAAGARPEHMPVIVAAVSALPQMGPEGGKSLLMSTSPQAPLLVVNGPIAEELGINARSALGPGFDNRVNIVIGARLLHVHEEHRALVPEQDGHGHHRHDTEVRPVHSREREDEPMAALPRGQGVRCRRGAR